jgi:flagellar basal body-associated protein FliL
MLKETVMSALKEKKTLKKVILASLAVLVAGGTIVLTVCSCDSEKEKEKTEERAAAPTFDTREALAEYALDAMINKDAEAYLNTLSPEALQQGIEIFGNRSAMKSAVQEFLNSYPDSAINQIRAALNDPEVKARMIADLVSDNADDLVQVDGKWYTNDGDWDKIAQLHTLSRLVAAAQKRDADAIWALLTNDSKTNMINRHGSEAKAKAAILAKFQIVPTSLTREAKAQYVNAFAEEFTRRGPGGRTILTEVDGKYFLHFNF